MKRLTKKEKKKIIEELRSEGWYDSLDDYYLYRLALKILDKQLCTT